MTDFNSLATLAKPTWCPGCGDFGIWNSVKRALIELNIPQKDTTIVSGIGCSSKLPHWVRTYGFHGVHGRLLPVATGIKLANHGLTVIAQGGDGDGYDEGMGHMIHAMRRNVDITYIVHNNGVFGLTKGQTSPTAPQEYKSVSTPIGVKDHPVNPLAIALSAGATFIARSFAGNMKHLTETLIAAIKHEGFSFIDVFQPCVTFNKTLTFDFFKERIYEIAPLKSRVSAYTLIEDETLDNPKKLPIGIFFREKRPVYHALHPQLRKKPLVHQSIEHGTTRLKKEFL